MLSFLLSVSKSKVMIIEPYGGYDFFQSFSEENWKENWVFTKKKNYTGKWTVRETSAPQGYEGEKMLFMKDGKAYFAASHPFLKPYTFTDKALVVQYELRYQDSHECAGGYLKLFSNENYIPEEVSNETRYSIMFGADHCATTNKVHFIIRYKDRKTGIISEKHLKNPPQITVDKINHLYTLIIRPDNTFAVYIDGTISRQGSLDSYSFEPGFNPPETIPDPNDTMPADWVTDSKIPDPDEKKPEDWDDTQPEFIPDPEKAEVPEGWLVNESLQITDPNATIPEDWDVDIMGEWEPPMIHNPKCTGSTGCGPYQPPLIKNDKYRGIWKAKLIDNPNYTGPWKPREIPNPDYYNETNVFGNIMPIYGLGFENWVVDKMVGFGNVWVGTNETAVHEWNKDHFIPKHMMQDIGAEGDGKKRPGEVIAKSFSLGSIFVNLFNEFMKAYDNAYEENPSLVKTATVVVIAVPSILFGFPILRIIWVNLIWPHIKKPINRMLQSHKKKSHKQKGDGSKKKK
jgi:calnexin